MLATAIQMTGNAGAAAAVQPMHNHRARKKMLAVPESQMGRRQPC